MKRHICILLLFSCHYIYSGNQGPIASSRIKEQQDHMGLKIDNTFKPENINTVTVYNEPKDPNDCTGLIGDALIKRMEWLSDQKWHENIIAFDQRKRLLYLKHSPIEQIKQDSLRLATPEGRAVIQKLGTDGAAFHAAMKKLIDDDTEARRFKPGKVALTLLCCFIGIGL